MNEHTVDSVGMKEMTVSEVENVSGGVLGMFFLTIKYINTSANKTTK